MPFDSVVYQFTAVGFQAMHLAPFLIGAYFVWRHQTSRRVAPEVAQVR